MKFIKRIVAVIMAAVMMTASVQSVSAGNLSDYYTYSTLDEVLANANVIKDGMNIVGFMENLWDGYWYRMEIENAGTLTLSAEIGVSDYGLSVYDVNGNIIKASKYDVQTGSAKYDDNDNLEIFWDKSKKVSCVTASYKVQKGTYLALVCNFKQEDDTGKVSFTANFPKASASQSSSDRTKKLIYEPFSEINKDVSYHQYLGKDLFYISTDSGNNCIYRIDDTVLKNWRSSGTLKAKKLSVDKKISANKGWDVLQMFSRGNYAVLKYQKNNVTYYSAVKYNKSKGTVTSYYTSKTAFSVSPGGNISQWTKSSDENELTLVLLNNKGKKVKTHKFNVTNKAWVYWGFTENENCALSAASYDEKTAKLKGIVYLIDNLGNITTLTKNAVSAGQLRSNYFMMINASTSLPAGVYVTDTKQTYKIAGKPMSGFTVNGNEYKLSSLGDRMYGTKITATYRDKYGLVNMYALADVSTGKLVSKKYYNMVTYDGMIYRVKNENGKYGYIDANGKELGWFDDAAAFPAGSKYTPVMKNGKTYLIDRNMKRVSKTTDLGILPLVTAYGTETYTWFDMNENYIMTFA